MVTPLVGNAQEMVTLSPVLVKTGLSHFRVTIREAILEFTIPSFTAMALMVLPEMFSVSGPVYWADEVVGLEPSVV